MSSSRTETENEEIAQHIYDCKYKKAAKKAGEEGKVVFGKVGVTKRMFARMRILMNSNNLYWLIRKHRIQIFI